MEEYQPQFTWLQRHSNPQTLCFINKHSTILPNSPNDWAVLWVLIFMVHWLCFCRVTYAFKGESALSNWLIVKEIFAWNRRDIWNLSNSNGTRTHNHVICKRTLNYLAKWLSCVVGTYLSGALVVCFYRVLCAFRVNLHSLFGWISRNSLFEADTISDIQVTTTELEPTSP